MSNFKRAGVPAIPTSAPWSVKGIEPKAREIAKDLARRSGMTLGEWLNTMIMEDDSGRTIGSGVDLARGDRVSWQKPVHFGSMADPHYFDVKFENRLRSKDSQQGRAVFIVLNYAIDLLGGRAVLHRDIHTALDAHELLHLGLPSKSLVHLVDRVDLLQAPRNFERALGMSQRTFQRRKEATAKPLNAEQSGRTWKFAEILAKGTAIFGSQSQAEQWLSEPAIGLNQKAPLDLLSTAAGLEAVEDYLGRVEYGVYA